MYKDLRMSYSQIDLDSSCEAALRNFLGKWTYNVNVSYGVTYNTGLQVGI